MEKIYVSFVLTAAIREDRLVILAICAKEFSALSGAT